MLCKDTSSVREPLWADTADNSICKSSLNHVIAGPYEAQESDAFCHCECILRGNLM